MLLGVAHEDGALFVALELGLYSVHGAESRDGDEFALGGGELVGGIDVAEKVSLHVVVSLWTESVVPRGAALVAGLHLGALFQRQSGIVPRCGTAEWLALVVVDALRLAVGEHSLQYAEGIERAWKAGVGIKLGEGVFQFVDGYTAIIAWRMAASRRMRSPRASRTAQAQSRNVFCGIGMVIVGFYSAKC